MREGTTPPEVAQITDFSGTWDVEYTVASCSSERPLHCPQLGTIGQLTLRLDDSGGSVEGYATVGRAQAPLSGRSSKGTASLQGRTVAGHDHETILDIRNLFLSLGRDSHLLGSFELHTTNRPVLTSIRGEIFRAASHRPLTALYDFSGTWRGWYVVRSCIRDSSVACSGVEAVGSYETLEIAIGTASRTLTLGDSRYIPLVAMESSSEIAFRSEETVFGDEHLTITRMSATRTRAGQMEGHLSYVTKKVDGRRELDVRTVELEMKNVVQIR